MNDKWEVVVWGSWPPFEYDNEEDARREAQKLRAKGIPQVSVRKIVIDLDDAKDIKEDR